MSIVIGAEAAQWAGLQIDLHSKYRSGKITPDQLEWWLNKSKEERDKLILSELASRAKPTPSKTRPHSILRHLTPNLIIPATDGTENLSDAVVFPGWVDSDLENWGCNVVSERRPETATAVHELSADGTSQQIFGGQGVDLDQLCLTPHQIKLFVITHREHLHPKGYATFFLFKVAGQFFVARVRWVAARQLEVLVSRLARGNVWFAGDRYRVVLPQLALDPSV